MRIREGALALALGLLAAGCASTHAPSGFLPAAVDAGRTATGGWLVARLAPTGRGKPAEVKGELLAVGAESVYVETRGGFVALPIARIEKAQLARYDSGWPVLAGLAVAGTLSTLSHGYVLIISAPVWMLTGTIATALASYEPILSPADDGWDRLGQFARFPQGLPPDYPRRRPASEGG